MLAQELTHVQPLFPQGAPVWYSEFSSDAQGLLNAAFKGQMSVGDALSQLASKATAHANAIAAAALALAWGPARGAATPCSAC